MDVTESLVYTHQLLIRLHVPHALIGGMALSEYGYGRGTQDVDWLIPEEFVATVESEFLKVGFEIFHRSADVLQFGGKSEVDFLIARRPISREMIKNAKQSQSIDLPVVLIEDLIGLKIQAFSGNEKRRHKDLADIQELVDRVKDIDWAKIKTYADYFNEWPTLQQIKESVK